MSETIDIYGHRKSMQAMLTSRIEDFMRRQLSEREAAHRIGSASKNSDQHTSTSLLNDRKFFVIFQDQTLEVPIAEGVHLYV